MLCASGVCLGMDLLGTRGGLSNTKGTTKRHFATVANTPTDALGAGVKPTLLFYFYFYFFIAPTALSPEKKYASGATCSAALTSAVPTHANNA